MEQTAWTIWQYDDNGEGIIMAFRRMKSPVKTVVVDIKGIDDTADYEFILTDAQDKKIVSGKELIKNGFEIILVKKYTSEIIKYRRV